VLPPRHEEAERWALHRSSSFVRTANACRTGRVFVTLPLLSHLRTKAGGRRSVTEFVLADDRVAVATTRVREESRRYEAGEDGSRALADRVVQRLVDELDRVLEELSL
jgi:predicted secreted Zn-dependent protease